MRSSRASPIHPVSVLSNRVCHQMTRTECLRSEVGLGAAQSEECLCTFFESKENFSWFQAVETSLSNGAGWEKESIILGGGTGRVLFSDRFPGRLHFVLMSRDG